MRTTPTGGGMESGVKRAIARWIAAVPTLAPLISTAPATDADGTSNVSIILQGLRWVLAKKDTYNIKVVDLSLGATPGGSYNSDVMATAAKALAFAGVDVAMSAGNTGPNAGTITSPGTDRTSSPSARSTTTVTWEAFDLSGVTWEGVRWKASRGGPPSSSRPARSRARRLGSGGLRRMRMDTRKFVNALVLAVEGSGALVLA